MATVEFNAYCHAEYQGKFEIPDEIKDNTLKVVRYVKAHLGEVPANDLEYINDDEEPVELEDIRAIY